MEGAQGGRPMSARDTVLASIRRSLGVTGAETERRRAVEERLMRAPQGVVPARGQVPPPEQVELFRRMFEAVNGTVARVASFDDVPAAVADYLRGQNLPQRLRRGDDPALAGLDWRRVPNLEVATGRADPDDLVGLSHASAAVAETGTLVLVSGPDNPTTLNFLPDTHVVVLEANDVVGDYEAVWERLRTRYGKGQMPRTVNMVTGPSRSADIEQTLLLGAHGPRRVHVVLVG